jgi:hypothetical protein
MNELPQYLIIRGAMSIGKNTHFLTDVKGPVQFLLRVGQMFFSMTMITLPILYFLFWKDAALLWIAGAAFLMILLLIRWEEKWIKLPHMRDKGAKAGVH